MTTEKKTYDEIQAEEAAEKAKKSEAAAEKKADADEKAAEKKAEAEAAKPKKEKKKLSVDAIGLKQHITGLSNIKDCVRYLVIYVLDHPAEAEAIRDNVDELAAAVATGVQGQSNVPAT